MSPKDTKKLTAPSSLTAPYSPKNNDNPTDIAHKEEEPKIHKKGEIENNETNVISVLTNVKPMPPGMFTDTRETTDEDVPLGTISNVATMLRHYRITNRYNVTRKKLEIIIPGMSCLSDNADNKALAYLTSLAALNRVPRTDLPAYLLAIGDDNRYNPVAEWINSVPWDGEDRLSQLLDTIRQTPEFPKTLKETLLKRWLISAVAAIYEKVGYRARGVLTLQGEQSVGKTTWINRLIDNELLRQEVIKLDHHLDAGNKDSITSAISHWIVEIGELDSSFRKDVARLKGFITADKDKLRRPYARVDSEYRRSTVFCASVNDDNFLVDDTGNSRWWTIPVASIDYEHKIDMQQMCTQVKTLWEHGDQWWLTQEEERELEKHNRGHRVVSVVREAVMDAIDLALPEDLKERMSASDVLKALKIDATNPKAKECAAILSELLGSPKKYGGVKKWMVPLKSNRVRLPGEEIMKF